MHNICPKIMRFLHGQVMFASELKNAFSECQRDSPRTPSSLNIAQWLGVAIPPQLYLGLTGPGEMPPCMGANAAALH